MKLLLDAHHSPRIAKRLRDLGHDVIAAADSPMLSSLSDADLLRTATLERRAVVTEDVRDFVLLARLWAQTREGHAGIVFTPAARFRRRRRAYPDNLALALASFVEAEAGEQDNGIWWLA